MMSQLSWAFFLFEKFKLADAKFRDHHQCETDFTSIALSAASISSLRLGVCDGGPAPVNDCNDILDDTAVHFRYFTMSTYC